MSKELVIGSNRHETKVAILEEDQLVEVYFQRGRNIRSREAYIKGASRACFPECSRHLWTWDSSATLSCTFRISSTNMTKISIR